MAQHIVLTGSVAHESTRHTCPACGAATSNYMSLTGRLMARCMKQCGADPVHMAEQEAAARAANEAIGVAQKGMVAK